MAINIVSFCEMCSNAFLAAIDNDEIKLETSQNDTKSTIVLNKESVEILEYHIKNLIKGECQFGANNILVATCNPKDNWRNINKAKCSNRYILTNEDVFDIEYDVLDSMLERLWKRLPKSLKNVEYISMNEVDFYDVSTYIQNKLEFVSIVPDHGYMLQDRNMLMFDRHLRFPRRIELDIDVCLKKFEVF